MSTISVYAFLAEGSEDGEYELWTTQSYPEAEEYAKQYGYAIYELEYEYSDSSLVVDYRPETDEDGSEGTYEEAQRIIGRVGINASEPWWVGRPDRDQLTGAFNPESQVQDPLTGEWHTKSPRR